MTIRELELVTVFSMLKQMLDESIRGRFFTIQSVDPTGNEILLPIIKFLHYLSTVDSVF